MKKIKKVSLEVVQASEATTRSIINEQEKPTSPRISISADFLDESNFISITPQSQHSHQDQEKEKLQEKRNINYATDFEFLSNPNIDLSSSHKMSSADELFFEGKLLPFWQMHQKLNKISLKTKDFEEAKEAVATTETRVSWFVDDDPSPRPPKCTVLWKELLRLKKQHASSSSSSSSLSPSSSSSSSSMADIGSKEEEEEEEEKKGSWNRDKKYVKRIKKGLERTRSASIRIRPIVNVPICTLLKTSALPPLKERKIREVKSKLYH